MARTPIVPEAFLHLSDQDRRDILQTAAAQLGQQAGVLEKDVWVCWALQALFAMPNALPMAFKGGTSLSKVFNAIYRFSEDVDITLDYRAFGEDFDPFHADVSRSALRKFSDRLKDCVRAYSHEVVLPYLNEKLAEQPTPEAFNIQLSEDGEKLLIHYPSAVEINSSYLQSSVLVEFGGRNVIDPNQRHQVSPYIAGLVSGLELPVAEVVVLSPERTFWEKATLIHVACNKGAFESGVNRLSRHWYDLVMLSRHTGGRKALENRTLLTDVVKHKEIFFNASYAHYGQCLTGGMRLLPNAELLDALQSDFEAMLDAGMLYVKSPSFDELVAELEVLEKIINAVQ
jgi:hypothetical protein